MLLSILRGMGVAGVSYSFAKRPFSAAKVPLATAMRIQGDVDRGDVLGEDILDDM